MKSPLGFILFGVGAYVLYEWYMSQQQQAGVSTTVPQSGQAPQLSQTGQTSNAPVTSVAPSGSVQAINTYPVSSPSSPTATPATQTVQGTSVNATGGSIQFINGVPIYVPNKSSLSNSDLISRLTQLAQGQQTLTADQWSFYYTSVLGYQLTPTQFDQAFPVNVRGVDRMNQLSASLWVSYLSNAQANGLAGLSEFDGLDGLGRAYTSGMGQIGAGYTMLNGGGGVPEAPPTNYPYSGGMSHFGDESYRYGYHNQRPTMVNMNPDASKYELSEKYVN